ITIYHYTKGYRGNIYNECNTVNISFSVSTYPKAASALQFLDGYTLVRKNTNITGDAHGFFGDLARRQISIFIESTGGGGCVSASAADSGNAGIGLNHIASSTDYKSLARIADQQ